MTRPIKFRVWDKQTNIMWYPEDMGSDYYITFDGRVVEVDMVGMWGMEHIEQTVAPEFELMQWTGVYDAYGTPVYEKDIVQFEFWCEGVEGFDVGQGEVYYNDGAYEIHYAGVMRKFTRYNEDGQCVLDECVDTNTDSINRHSWKSGYRNFRVVGNSYEGVDEQ